MRRSKLCGNPSIDRKSRRDLAIRPPQKESVERLMPRPTHSRSKVSAASRSARRVATCHSEIILLDRHIEYLNFLAGLVYLRHQTVVSRDQCLCADIEFLRTLRLDFSRCRSVNEMTVLLGRVFAKFPHRLRNPPLRIAR